MIVKQWGACLVIEFASRPSFAARLASTSDRNEFWTQKSNPSVQRVENNERRI